MEMMSMNKILKMMTISNNLKNQNQDLTQEEKILNLRIELKEWNNSRYNKLKMVLYLQFHIVLKMMNLPFSNLRYSQIKKQLVFYPIHQVTKFYKYLKTHYNLK